MLSPCVTSKRAWARNERRVSDERSLKSPFFHRFYSPKNQITMSSENFTKNPERVAAGLKATVHNPNATADARSSAAQRLREMNVDPEEPLSSRNAKEVSGETGQHLKSRGEAGGSHGGAKSSAEVHEHHIMGGYKAALKNPKVSPEAKHHAEQALEKEHTHENAHEHHILGGYKATLKNPNASPEAKQHAEKMLAQHHKTE